MDEYVDLRGQVFEWNREKADKNKKDHDGISFELAATAFADPNSIQLQTMSIQMMS